jgi:hypothetical protein
MEYRVADEAVVGVPAMEPVEPSSERPEGSEVPRTEYEVTEPPEEVTLRVGIGLPTLYADGEV